MNTTDILAETKWEHPSDYGGYSPEGHYVIAVQTRGSDALERSNYECIFKDLGAVRDDRDAPVHDFRASHWACGWVEYIIVRSDAPQKTLDQAAETIAALSDYPVYNEDHFSELEWTESEEYWAGMSIGERIGYLRDSGLSIFAARSDGIPQDDDGTLYEMLRG